MTSIPWNRINTGLLLLVLLAIIGLFASRAYGGPLDPPAAPTASGTLPQVEPRSPIPPVGWSGTFPIVISQPGSYFLTHDHWPVWPAPTASTSLSMTSASISTDSPWTAWHNRAARPSTRARRRTSESRTA